MPSEVSEFGTTQDGSRVDIVTLRNSGGSIAKIMTWGATIVELHVPDRDGNLGNVVLGHDDFAGYEHGGGYLGATVGRVANRIGGGRFTLDGREYQVPTNNGKNALHGGPFGYSKRLWEIVGTDDEKHGRFRLTDPDGCMGFPGTVTVEVAFELTDGNELKIHYHATTDKPTPINLTNHSYFNLLDGGRSSIADHEVTLTAFKYTPVNEELIPTGEIALVEGTLYDLRKPVRIGERLEHIPGNPPGYDTNFVVDTHHAAEVYEPVSGRRMVVATGQPGIQFYTGNQLNGSMSGHGAVFERYHGMCFEAQHFPDSVNHPNFPTTILRPGERYEHKTEYRFSVVG